MCYHEKFGSSATKGARTKIFVTRLLTCDEVCLNTADDRISLQIIEP